MSHSNWLKNRKWAVFTVGLLGLYGLLFGGCASTKIQAQWADPQFAGRSLRGATVLVVCDASAAAIKRICQDQLAARIATSAATPVMAPEVDFLIAEDGQMADNVLAAARRVGANAIWGSIIAPDVTVVSPGPTVGFGLGGFGSSGGRHRWGGVGGGVGVTVPVGGERVNTAYAADMSLTDVDTGRLMWTGNVTTPASRSAAGSRWYFLCQQNRLSVAPNAA